MEHLQSLSANADRMATSPPEPFDSWFEVDVFLYIHNRGYRVLPQYEAAGYRIDLVVEGMNQRIAVECDGDHWHGAEHYEHDMARQRVLERCGWQFCRIRGSRFALDPNEAMSELFNLLDRLEPGQNSNNEALIAPVPSSDERDGGDGVSINEHSVALPEPDIVRSDEPQYPLPIDDTAELNRPLLHVQSSSRGRSVAPDSSYEEWIARPLPDPTTSSPSDLVEGLVEIVKSEGPLGAIASTKSS